LLSGIEKITPSKMALVCNDVISESHKANAILFAEIIESVRGASLSSHELNALNILRSWNGDHQLNDKGPVVYYRTLARVLHNMMADEMGEDDYNQFKNTHQLKNALSSLLENEASPWWDDLNTSGFKESRNDIIFKSFRQGVKDLITSLGPVSVWQWGRLHTLEHIHPLGRVKPLDRIFNVGPYPIAGGIETINNAPFPLDTTGIFKVSYGPAMRTLIDLADMTRAISVLPTGQSGHIMSRHYNDQALLHANGRYRPMLTDSVEIFKRFKHLKLQP
jgi:penicillin amidase